MYRIYGLIAPNSDITIQSILHKVRAEFPNANVALNGEQITVTRGEWDFEFLALSGPEVLSESKGIAERMAGLGEDYDVATCDRRIEAWSETPDPMLEYFEDYHRIVGVLKSFPGLIVVDPKEPSFL